MLKGGSTVCTDGIPSIICTGQTDDCQNSDECLHSVDQATCDNCAPVSDNCPTGKNVCARLE